MLVQNNKGKHTLVTMVKPIRYQTMYTQARKEIQLYKTLFYGHVILN